MQNVNELVAWLKSFERRIDLDALQARLRDESISTTSLNDYIQFSEERYSRNLLAKGAQFYALVMCWLPGQASPIHDHRGASCAVRVIDGVATETSFRREGGRLLEAGVSMLRAGEVCGSFDDDIHEIRNNEHNKLVTLHVYSPCLDNINLYARDSGKITVFSDPLVAEPSA